MAREIQVHLRLTQPTSRSKIRAQQKRVWMEERKRKQNVLECLFGSGKEAIHISHVIKITNISACEEYYTHQRPSVCVYVSDFAPTIFVSAFFLEMDSSGKELHIECGLKRGLETAGNVPRKSQAHIKLLIPFSF